jgi:hypothetical protein
MEDRKNKSLPQLQLADLVLFPIAKGRYQPGYRPYMDLMNAGKPIDDQLPESLKEVCGIKYSCFDTSERPKAQEEAPEPLKSDLRLAQTPGHRP